MMQIEQWFPIHIGVAHNPFHKEVEDELTQQCLKIKKSYKKDFGEFRKASIINRSQTPSLDWYHFQDKAAYKLLEDQKFNRLHNWIDDQVKEYKENLTLNMELNRTEGWFNIFEKYEYSGYHDHRPCVLSCVYFLNCEEGVGAKLLFRNNNDALVVYCTPNVEGPVLPLMYHNPFPGKLVVFSGSLEHAVQQQNTDNLRITLAYNYT